ncbi:hypothetical protein GXB85_08490 [Cellulomonas sp. APG4]|uniref:hypothetical protein n=1 Tax=Cellulomonas sp. APG4 TaxID=1538656 RepID=UPI00137A7BF8|nr:hypothetical protein [Cellulomonas sp. APG4]NCT90982.1 hypothetical protein [Cellulomonas sp. APG4]
MSALPAAPQAAGPTRITEPAGAEVLAAHLLDPDRRLPVAVVSIPSGEQDPWILADEVARDVAGLAEVYVLPTDECSWRLSALLPDMTQVYGGAGRVYPTGLAWTKDPFASPLRFAYDAAEGQRATDELTRDALGMAARAGVSASTMSVLEASGTVTALAPPSRALVRLDDGEPATIWQELTLPSVPIEHLVERGMAVSGRLDPETRRLDIAGLLMTSQALELTPGTTVLAKVVEVRPDVAHLALLPDVVVPVQRHRVTANPNDTLTSLLTVGEVVVARVETAGSSIALRLDDVDEDDEPLAAPSLIAGGPPWLAPPTFGPLDETDVSPAVLPPVEAAPRPQAIAAVAPPATRTLSLSLDAARARISALEAELHAKDARLEPLERELAAHRRRTEQLTEEVQRLREQVAHQKTHLRLRSNKMAKQKVAVDPDVTTQRWFVDPAEQFRYEVYAAWVRRIPAGEKHERALTEYTLGPDFLRSMERIEGVPREKVLNVVVEVLTGIAERAAGREMHPLRSGAGGADPVVTRADGATCWRVSLQSNTPQARRLHFWRREGMVEFSRVVLHDDMSP